MRVSILILFSFVLSISAFGQEILDVTDRLPNKQNAYTEISDLDMFIKLEEGYEPEINNGFHSYYNKNTKSRIQYMILEMPKDEALDQVMRRVDDSKDSEVIKEEYLEVEGNESFFFSVKNTSGSQDRIEFYLVTQHNDSSVVFKGSSLNELELISEIKEMIISLKRGF